MRTTTSEASGSYVTGFLNTVAKLTTPLNINGRVVQDVLFMAGCHY